MNSNIPTFKSFEASILFMNGMYNLPIAPYPTTFQVILSERSKKKEKIADTEAVTARLNGFFFTLQTEMDEGLDLRLKLVSSNISESDFLVELADWLADMTVYIRSEATKFGIPLEDVIKIVMDSNFSKLGADGKPIIDGNGKFLKGPNYWKPEPKIRELLLERITEATTPKGNEWTDYGAPHPTEQR